MFREIKSGSPRTRNKTVDFMTRKGLRNWQSWEAILGSTMARVGRMLHRITPSWLLPVNNFLNFTTFNFMTTSNSFLGINMENFWSIIDVKNTTWRRHFNRKESDWKRVLKIWIFHHYPVACSKNFVYVYGKALMVKMMESPIPTSVSFQKAERWARE